MTPERVDSATTVDLVEYVGRLIKAGLPLEPALRAASQDERRQLSTALRNLADQFANGGSLPEALQRYPHLASLAMLLSAPGLDAQHTAAILETWVDARRREQAFRRKWRPLIVYPAFVTAIIACLLIWYCLPGGLLEQLDQLTTEDTSKKLAVINTMSRFRALTLGGQGVWTNEPVSLLGGLGTGLALLGLAIAVALLLATALVAMWKVSGGRQRRPMDWLRWAEIARMAGHGAAAKLAWPRVLQAISPMVPTAALRQELKQVVDELETGVVGDTRRQNMHRLGMPLGLAIALSHPTNNVVEDLSRSSRHFQQLSDDSAERALVVLPRLWLVAISVLGGFLGAFLVFAPLVEVWKTFSPDF